MLRSDSSNDAPSPFQETGPPKVGMTNKSDSLGTGKRNNYSCRNVAREKGKESNTKYLYSLIHEVCTILLTHITPITSDYSRIHIEDTQLT